MEVSKGFLTKPHTHYAWAGDTGQRGGIVYGGVIYKGQAMFGGINSEKVLHKVQNGVHDRLPGVDKTPYFRNLHYSSKGYGYYGNYNANYLFY